MTNLQKEIIKKAGCNELDLSLRTMPEIKKDISRRLTHQRKAFSELSTITRTTADAERRIIEDSIERLSRTLKAINAA